MEYKKTYVILVITQYHLKQLLLLVKELQLNSTKNYIIHSNHISEHELDGLNAFKTFRYETTQLQLRPLRIHQRAFTFLKNPNSVFLDYRRLVEKNSIFISSSLEEELHDKVDLIIFNDRDFLVQLSINYLRNKRLLNKVIAVDEGLGYYIKEKTREKILKVLYSLFSISVVYLRFPEMLTNKRPEIEYVKIKELKLAKISNHLVGKTVLFCSTLLSEEGYQSLSEELNFYRTVANNMVPLDCCLYLKPHPREDRDKLNRIEEIIKPILGSRFYLSDSKIPAESIDYNTFDYVVNFGSTIILDILGSGYNAKRVITVRLYNFGIIEHLFGGTTIVSLKNLSKEISRKLNE